MTECLVECCRTPPGDPLFQSYHDIEWGLPASDDQAFFEKICLEGFQAGLSWRTVLHRRQDLREAFSNFCPEALAQYSATDVQRILGDARLIRNERTIRSVFNNATRLQELKCKSVSLAALFWSHEPDSDLRPRHISNAWLLDNPSTPESTVLAKSLKRMGWSFVGPTTLYATMQALGVVNDHVFGCPRRESIDLLRDTFQRPRCEGGTHW